ncbi:UNVERIFIED_CONTAM: hypothetical protein H355_011114, partial [Colinus virginianus]
VPARLSGGRSQCQGRVDLLQVGAWTSVCAVGWDLAAARVLCRQLGCGRPRIVPVPCSPPVDEGVAVGVRRVLCAGQEQDLEHCELQPGNAAECPSDRVAAVNCEEPFRLRLSDGPRRCAGRLEVQRAGLWGTVCNDGWSRANAAVVCQELGCGEAQGLDGARPRFGAGAGRIWLDDVRCRGQEKSLKDCVHRAWGYHDCTHREDIGVVCQCHLGAPSARYCRAMAEPEEDEEDNAATLEQLMVQAGRALQWHELEEQFCVLGELGSGTYGHVVLTEPRDGGKGLGGLCPSAAPCACIGARGQPLHWSCTLLEGLPEVLVKRCASQLAEALDFMHSRALVHRDVKLDNVLLFDHECRRVKLADFGLTRLQGSEIGAMSGALPYAPPELCLLQGSDTLELDSSLDVWAFAVLLFCLCTGCFPWAVAASPDPQFEAFSAWQGDTGGREAPQSWGGFECGAQEMLQRLLRLDPDRRSPAIEVHKYLALPWLTAARSRDRTGGTDGLRAVDGGGGRGGGDGDAHGEVDGGPQSSLARGSQGSGDDGECGGSSYGEGNSVPATPASAVALCH